jgi:hypothetical protein
MARREQVRALRCQQPGGPEHADPAQVHDRHIGRAARADRQGQLGVDGFHGLHVTPGVGVAGRGHVE